jgi:hypothetical protein
MPEDITGEFVLQEENSSISGNNSEKSDEKKPETQKISPKNKYDIKPENKKAPHFFSSFCYYPKGVSFATQQEEEEIILLIRRDFITNVPWIFAVFGLLAIPFLIAPFFDFLFPIPLSDTTLSYLLPSNSPTSFIFPRSSVDLSISLALLISLPFSIESIMLSI